MRPDVTPFHHAPTGSWTYVVEDKVSKSAVVVDPVLDYDWRSARTSTRSAEAVAAHCDQRGLAVRSLASGTATDQKASHGLARSVAATSSGRSPMASKAFWIGCTTKGSE